jgi:hypothetical protein
MALSRQHLVESYSSWSVSTVEMSTPATFRLSLPVVTPSARTKKAGQQLWRAEELAWMHRSVMAEPPGAPKSRGIGPDDGLVGLAAGDAYRALW